MHNVLKMPPQETKNQIPKYDVKNVCTPIFTVALFTVVKRRKQPKCSQRDDYINKMWSIIHGMTY